MCQQCEKMAFTLLVFFLYTRRLVLIHTAHDVGATSYLLLIGVVDKELIVGIVELLYFEHLLKMGITVTEEVHLLLKQGWVVCDGTPRTLHISQVIREHDTSIAHLKLIDIVSHAAHLTYLAIGYTLTARRIRNLHRLFCRTIGIVNINNQRKRHAIIMERRALPIDKNLLRHYRSDDLDLILSVGRHAAIVAVPATNLHHELVALALSRKRCDGILCGIVLVIARILIILSLTTAITHSRIDIDDDRIVVATQVL